MRSNGINFFWLIHAFTCAGMLPSQYYHFCQLASLGTVGKRYTDTGNSEF